MTPEKQRLAIAKACPNIIRANPKPSDYLQSDVMWEYFDGSAWLLCQANDPLKDLNAMHEVEKDIANDDNVIFEYAMNLVKIVVPFAAYGEYSYTQAFELAHATAAQRAEALLKTLNLWTDEQN